jgi:hypothetical protein
VPAFLHSACMDAKGAKILRDRLEELHGALPDAEPTEEVQHGLPVYGWLGITPAEPDDHSLFDAS